MKAKATPYTVLALAIGALFAGFLFWRGAPDQVKLAGAIGGVLVAFLGGLLTGPDDSSGPKAGGAAAAVVGLVLLAQQACTPAEKQAARTALEVTQVACIVANAALQDAEIATLCGIANDAIPAMQDLLASARRPGAGPYRCLKVESSMSSPKDAGRDH
jgi:hypothetical protein